MIKTFKIRIFSIICLSIFLSACSSFNVGDTKDNSDDNPKIFKNVSKIIDNSNNSESDTYLIQGLKDENLVVKGKNDDYINLSINIKEENYGLLCNDPVYNILYYINLGVDNFIYRIKDGKSELVLELPAKRLFCMDGKLYFMLETYDTGTINGMVNGNIFCYDPVSGVAKKIIDVNAYKMFVYQDGIYYLDANTETKSSNGITSWNMYYYSFLTKNSEKINAKYISLLKWKDYHLAFEVREVDEEEVYQLYGIREKLYQATSMKLETLDQSKSIKLTDAQVSSNYSIAGDKLYYVYDNKSFNICDLETQEIKEIPLAKECDKDFIVLNNGMIYLDSLICINPETGMQSIITPENEAEVLYELYTDGENLYGVVNPPYAKGYIRRIVIEEDPDNARILTNEDGITYEINRYVYHTLPMGEKE